MHKKNHKEVQGNPNFFVGVPFSGCEKHIKDALIATREDEAVAIATGAWLMGKKPLVYLQNSGLGNCIDAITSLVIPYGIRLDYLIDNRKEPEHHKFMGRLTEDLVKDLWIDDTTKYC
jgi:sulfopyruvate decarboxylase TPP-binding subunit